MSDEEVWMRAWCAWAKNCEAGVSEPKHCTNTADYALEEFKKRFRTKSQGYAQDVEEKS